MVKKSDISEIIKVGLILFVITAVAAAILAGVNGVTAPIIEANMKRTQDQAMKVVLPEAEVFEKIDTGLIDDIYVKEVYTAGDAGACVKVAPYGYGGEISMIVGIDNEYKVTGVEIISHSETASLGAKCTDEEFKAQFVGKTEGVKVVKKNAGGNEIDAISSATVTSKAVTRGVNSAISAVKFLKGGE